MQATLARRAAAGCVVQLLPRTHMQS